MSHLVSFLARANRGEEKKRENKRKKRKKRNKKEKEKKGKNFKYVFGMNSRVFHGD